MLNADDLGVARDSVNSFISAVAASASFCFDSGSVLFPLLFLSLPSSLLEDMIID